MSDKPETPADGPPMIVNSFDAPARERTVGEYWGAKFKSLTPSMRPRGGNLSVNWMHVPPGRTAVPMHAHQREDEVFYVLSGSGVLRYGDEMREIRPGDCISCPRGTGVGHQIANTSETEPLEYLAIGPYDEDEVCIYPDSGKVSVRSLGRIGWLENVEYLEGEPEVPRIIELIGSKP